MNMTFQKEGKTLPCSCLHCDYAFKKMDLGTIGKWLAECRYDPPQVIFIQGGTTHAALQFQWPIVGDSPLSFCSHFTEKKDGEKPVLSKVN